MRPIGGRTRAWCQREAAEHHAVCVVAGSALLFGLVLAAARMHQPAALTARGIGIAAGTYALFGLAALRRWPSCVAVATTCAGILISLAAGTQDWLNGPLMLLTLFIFALTSERRTVILGTLTVIAAVVGGHLLIGLRAPYPVADLAAPPWMALAAALGQAVRGKRAQQAMLEERATRAEQGREAEARRRVQDERLRIARDLHDAVGHHVALISVQAGAMGYLLDSDPDKARDSLAHIQQASEAALEELRLTVGLLRQPGEAEPVEPLGGLTRLDDLIGSFTATGLRVTRSTAGQVRPLPEALDLTAYRVIQESLTNTAKHAPGASASVLLAFGTSTLTLTVDDDGPGCVTPGESGHGIIGMRERAAALGGWLTAGRRADGRGFRVTAMLPIPASRAAGSCR